MLGSLWCFQSLSIPTTMAGNSEDWLTQGRTEQAVTGGRRRCVALFVAAPQLDYLVPSTALKASTTVLHSRMRAPFRRAEACTLLLAGITKVLNPSCKGGGRVAKRVGSGDGRQDCRRGPVHSQSGKACAIQSATHPPTHLCRLPDAPLNVAHRPQLAAQAHLHRPRGGTAWGGRAAGTVRLPAPCSPAGSRQLQTLHDQHQQNSHQRAQCKAAQCKGEWCNAAPSAPLR